MSSRLSLTIASIAMLASLCGCGSGERQRLAHEAQQLRVQVPGLLHTHQRQALLYATAAQRLDPTTWGKWLLMSADEGFEGVQRVLEPVDPSTVAAIRTPTTVISSDRGGVLRTWDAKSGQMLASRRLKSAIVRFATSESSDLVASLDAGGDVELWNLAEPRDPLQSRLGRIPSPSRDRVVAFAFASQDARLLALTRSGLVYVFDVTAGKRIGVIDLRDARGTLPWSPAGVAPRLTAAEIREDPLTRSTSLLVATAQKGVARIDLQTLRGVTIVPQGQFVGQAIAVAGGGPGETVVACTTAGMALWVAKTHTVEQVWTGPCTGLALEAGTLTTANAQGIDATLMGPQGPEEDEALESYAGRPARVLIGGLGGPVEIGQDGSISLLEREETGINLRTGEGESSLVAQFGADGDLLETYGVGNGAEGLMTVRPGSPGTAYGTQVPNRVLRRYTPSRRWWPQSGAPDRWLIDSAQLGAEYVVAGGRDPTGAASVLVWDARTGRPLRRLTTTESGPLSSAAVSAQIPAAVTQVALLPGRQLLAAYSAQQELIVLWSTETWRQVAAVYVGPIAGFSVSPDESQLLAVSLSDEQSLIEVGNRVNRLLFLNVGSGQIERQVQSPHTDLASYIPEEGAGIVAIQSGGQIRTLDVDGNPTKTPPMMLEAETPRSLAWKPHTQIMAVGLRGGGVRLVDLPERHVSEPLRSPAHTEPLDLSFSPNGLLLAAGNGNSSQPASPQPATPSMWTIDDRHLEQRACSISGGQPTAAQWRAWTGGLLRYVHACSTAGVAHSGSPAKKPSIQQPQVALQHGEELEAVSADGTRAKIGSAEVDFAAPKFVWSQEGALAWLDGGILHLLEPSGDPHEAVCACSSVAFAGSEVVAVSSGGKSLVDFGRSLASRTNIQVAGLPPYGLTIVGVAKQGVVVAGSAFDGATGPGPSSLYLVKGAGRVRRLASLPGFVYNLGVLNPAGSELAMSAAENGGVCYLTEHVAILDLQTGKVTLPAMPGGVAMPQVRQVGWGSGGRLTAEIASNACNGQGQESKDASEAKLYEAQDGRLLARGPVGYETQRGAMVRAAIRGPVATATQAGTLTIAGKRGNLVAKIPDVSSFSVKP